MYTSQITTFAWSAVPCDQELQKECAARVSDLRSIREIIQWLRDIECPFRQEATLRAFRRVWHRLERECSHIATYQTDDCWCLRYPDIDLTIDALIAKAKRLQDALTTDDTQEPALVAIKPQTTSHSPGGVPDNGETGFRPKGLFVNTTHPLATNHSPFPTTPMNQQIIVHGDYYAAPCTIVRGDQHNHYTAAQPSDTADTLSSDRADTTHTDNKDCAPAHEAPAAPSTAQPEPNICCYIILDAIKPAAEIEREMRDAAHGSAATLVGYLKMAVRLGYVDLRGDNAKTIYTHLRDHFGLTYQYKNFSKYFS